MNCELCGKDAESVVVIIEGSEFSVCRDCSKFGKVIEKPVFEKKELPKKPGKEILQVIVPDFAERIRNAREKKGLRQKDFARKISEKESLIHSLETGKHEPSLDLARKLENVLGITLVEQHEEVPDKQSKASSDGFTIGDIVNIKK